MSTCTCIDAAVKPALSKCQHYMRGLYLMCLIGTLNLNQARAIRPVCRGNGDDITMKIVPLFDQGTESKPG